MANKLYEEQDIQNIANSIRAKNGSNDTYTLSQMATAINNLSGSATLQSKSVTITSNGSSTVTADSGYNGLSSVAITANVLGGGNPVAASNDVILVDYDGTIRYSYSASDFANLSSLPSNPTHSGLTAQGWNWTLSDAKTYVANYGKLVIGQTYVTDDNKTRIYIELTEGRTSPHLGFGTNGTATVSWGDGTTSTVNGSVEGTVINTQHNYSSAGSYTITIQSENRIVFMGESTTGSKVLWANSSSSSPNRVYQNAIKKVELGNAFPGNYAFYNATGLKSISMPAYGANQYAFYNATSLKGLVLPIGVTSASERMCNGCVSLLNVSLPKNLTVIKSYSFAGCTSLTNISIPDTVTTITSSVFQNCSSLRNISFPSSINQLSEASSWCSGCYALNNVICGNLSLVPSSAFNNCYSISHFDCPGSITEIKNSAFSNCYGVKYYDFSNHSSVPTLQNANAFSNISADCQIIVPDSLYSTWIAATNWSTYASNIVKASEA